MPAITVQMPPQLYVARPEKRYGEEYKQVYTGPPEGWLAEERFEAPINEPFFPKPRGGFWTSTYDEEYGCDWIHFCLAERFQEPPYESYLLIPDTARVFVIDTLDDLKELLQEYSVSQPLPAMPPELAAMGFGEYLNYERLAQDYDAIHLTQRGQWRTRLTSPNLYGWDCESTLWLRWKFLKIEYLGELNITERCDGETQAEHRKRLRLGLDEYRVMDFRTFKSGLSNEDLVADQDIDLFDFDEDDPDFQENPTKTKSRKIAGPAIESLMRSVGKRYPGFGGNCGMFAYGVGKALKEIMPRRSYAIGFLTEDISGKEYLRTGEPFVHHVFLIIGRAYYDATGKIDRAYLKRFAIEEENDHDAEIYSGFPLEKSTLKIIDENTAWKRHNWEKYYRAAKKILSGHENPDDITFTFLGPCDRLRMRSPENEDRWQEMMRRRVPVTMEEMEAVCEMETLLDEGESIEDFGVGDPDLGYYRSVWGDSPCMFIQTHGFEFIFVPKTRHSEFKVQRSQRGGA